MTRKELIQLADRITSGTASEEEILYFNRLIDSASLNKTGWEDSYGDKDNLQKEIKRNIFFESGIKQRNNNRNVIWFKWVSSAAAIFLAVFLTYNFFKGADKESPIAKTTNNTKLTTVKTGASINAILTLSDGTTIILDSVQNGTVATQGKSRVIKMNGLISYSKPSSDPSQIAYNTISTARGGLYQVELADGSKVWLNASSSLRFPVTFTGKERTVEVKGEAYFEIAKNKNSPFVVQLNNSSVKVLGTHFNIMSYEDEPTLATTLFEGAIKFCTPGKTDVHLYPGQQSLLTPNGGLQVTNDVNLPAVIAWKEGLIYFSNEEIEPIIRKLSRMYDVDIVCEGRKTNELFNVEMPGNSSLSDVLKVLELMSGMHFEVEGTKIKAEARNNQKEVTEC